MMQSNGICDYCANKEYRPFCYHDCFVHLFYKDSFGDSWDSQFTGIEVEPVRHGKWITTRTEKHDGEYYCNQCDEEAHWVWTRDKQILSKYCPSCGAKMDGDE